MLPKVVIVGRPNVGKSSLLNMLARRRVSITDPTPGVTRDRISTYATLHDAKHQREHTIELVDTGGHGIEDVQNLTREVEAQIAAGVAEADLILFVVDAQSGIVPLDEAAAKLLRRAGCVSVWKKPRDVNQDAPAARPPTPVLLIANKVDDESFEPQATEAASLGFGEPITVSATNRYNRRSFSETLCRVLDRIAPRRSDDAAADERTQVPDPGMLLAIVGKRNAGKSTLVNALAGSQRVIVSEIEGTTRDSIDVCFEIEGRVFTAIDTAGVRKRKSLADDIEYYSHHRALRSIRRADVVLFLIDSTVPVSQVDKQLSLEIQKHHKPCVVVVNKWDLAEEKSSEDDYLKYLDDVLKGLSFAPIVFISAKAGEGVRDVVAMALNLFDQAGHRVSTGELNRLIQAIYERHIPRMKHGKRPKIYYGTQVSTHPPTISLFVNDPSLFTPAYERYIVNRLRDELPFSEVPIKIVMRGKSAMAKEAETATVDDETA